MEQKSGGCVSSTFSSPSITSIDHGVANVMSVSILPWHATLDKYISVGPNQVRVTNEEIVRWRQAPEVALIWNLWEENVETSTKAKYCVYNPWSIYGLFKQKHWNMPRECINQTRMHIQSQHYTSIQSHQQSTRSKAMIPLKYHQKWKIFGGMRYMWLFRHLKCWSSSPTWETEMIHEGPSIDHIRKTYPPDDRLRGTDCTIADTSYADSGTRSHYTVGNNLWEWEVSKAHCLQPKFGAKQTCISGVYWDAMKQDQSWNTHLCNSKSPAIPPYIQYQPEGRKKKRSLLFATPTRVFRLDGTYKVLFAILQDIRCMAIMGLVEWSCIVIGENREESRVARSCTPKTKTGDW